MAKFRGRVGFVVQIDNQETGIISEEAMEKIYRGDVLENSRRWQSSDMVTDDLQMGNQISIVANDYAYRFASAIKYCEYMHNLWTVTSVKVKRPRIILTLGGVYNGKRSNSPPGYA